MLVSATDKQIKLLHDTCQHQVGLDCRSTLSMHEDEQLFLDESSSHLAQEQMEVTKKVNRVTPLVRVFGAASGVLMLVIAGIWVYQSLTTVQ